MNSGFSEFLKATPHDRRDVYLATAARLGAPEQNVEKDFWVTWTLDVLFNGLPAGHPRFLFKGGTSLSKAYGLISRFSEDIDITVFREDLGAGGLDSGTRTSEPEETRGQTGFDQEHLPRLHSEHARSAIC